MTLFTASRKSFSVTVFLLALIAYIPASVHTLLISAPARRKFNRTSQVTNLKRQKKEEYVRVVYWLGSLPVEFGQRRARSSKRMSLSQFMVLV